MFVSPGKSQDALQRKPLSPLVPREEREKTAAPPTGISNRMSNCSACWRLHSKPAKHWRIAADLVFYLSRQGPLSAPPLRPRPGGSCLRRPPTSVRVPPSQRSCRRHG